LNEASTQEATGLIDFHPEGVLAAVVVIELSLAVLVPKQIGSN